MVLSAGGAPPRLFLAGEPDGVTGWDGAGWGRRETEWRE